MKIKNVNFNVSTIDVLTKLQKTLQNKGSGMLSSIKPINGYVLITCPYHKNGLEKKPSAQVRESDGLFFCFACRETHSLPEVVEHCLHENGWNWLLENFASSEIEDRQIELFDKDEKVQNEFVPKEELVQYRRTHEYMFKRKLNMETIRKFDIGFDAVTNCITFPVKDADGNILFIARRSVQTKYFNYPFGAKKPIYGLYELLREQKRKQINAVYVCESMLDALSIWSWGGYAVALNGLGSATQYKELELLPVRTLILATDNDEAGRRARTIIKKHVKSKIIKELDYESYGTCKDINDMTKEQFLGGKVRWIV